jgi:hypothetical protein
MGLLSHVKENNTQTSHQHERVPEFQQKLAIGQWNAVPF